MENIVAEILRLPLEQRRQIYRALQDDLDEPTAPDQLNEPSPLEWQLINDRIDEVETGQVKLIGHEEMMEWLQNRKYGDKD